MEGKLVKNWLKIQVIRYLKGGDSLSISRHHTVKIPRVN